MHRALGQLILESPQLAPLALVLAAVALGAMVVLYGPQSRGLGWSWRTGLWALRCAAILAVVGSVVKPVVLRERRVGEDSAAVVLLIDTSKSMGLRDYAAATTQPTTQAAGAATMPGPAARYASPDVEQTLVALADGLGMLPTGTRSARTVEVDGELSRVLGLLDDLRQVRSEWEYARLSGRGVDQAEARVTTATGGLVAAVKHLSDLSNGAQTGGTSLKTAIARLLTACQRLGMSRLADADIRNAHDLAQTARDRVRQAQGDEDRRLYETNQAVQIACNDVARETRLELVEQAIANPDAGLLWRLPRGVPVFAFTIGQGVRSIPVATGDESDSLKDLRPVGELDLAADATRSDLSGSVASALSRLDGVPVAAVVLYSDGREVIGTGTANSVKSVASAGSIASDVPVLAVLSGPLAGPLCDIALTRLTVPAAPYAGETMHVHAVLTQEGTSGRAVEVRCDVDGEPTQFRRLVLGDLPADVDFEVKMEHPGLTKVSVSVPALSDEATVDNNRAVAWTKVQSGPLKVAMLSSTANWDQQYLRNALARCPWVKLTEAMAMDTSSHVTLTAAQLLDQDVIVLDDLAVDALDESQWQAVEQMASRQGGGVLMIAGAGHLPAEYAARPDLAAMLPYKPGATAFKTWPGTAAHYHLTVAAGLTDPAVLETLRLDDDADIGAAWSDLPALFRYLAIPALKNPARAMLVESESNAPVLVQQRLGAGRTILCGIDQTWRWRFKAGDTNQERFWLQLIRYVAGEPYAVRANRGWLDAEPVMAEPGQMVRVRVKIAETAGGTAGAALPTVELWKGNDHVSDRELNKAIGAGEFAGSITMPPLTASEETGGREIEYTLRLKGTDAAMPLYAWRNYQAELANLSASEQPMRRMAESSGGAMLTLDQVANLPQRIEAARGRVNQFVELRLWDSAYLYLFVLACLSGEWAMRKLVGLV